MTAWLVATLLPILKPFGAWLIGLFTKDVIAMIMKAITDWQAKRQADNVQKDNLAKYADAVKKGDDDAQAKIGSDILNGSSSN